MKKKIIKGIIIYVLVFASLFILRFAYDLIMNALSGAYRQTANQMEMSVINEEISVSYSRKNYATEKIQYKSDNKSAVQMDQKYEKTANLTYQSKDYDQTEKQIRDATKRYNAVIQFEQNSGLGNGRRLFLTIGVAPDKFDMMLEDIKTYGELKSIEISKLDKTDEYRLLDAKRESLSKKRNALLSLKSRGGSLEELIKLENQIFEVESQIQEMGVKLGDFEQETGFCTIKVSLYASATGGVGHFIGYLFRTAINSFKVTAEFYALLTVFVFFAVCGVLIIILLLNKLKSIKGLFENKEDDKP